MVDVFTHVIYTVFESHREQPKKETEREKKHVD